MNLRAKLDQPKKNTTSINRSFANIRRWQRGGIAISSAIMLTMLLGFSALAIDIGNFMVARNELQNAADAAALGGAACLYPRAECGNATATAPDWSTADTTASTFATSTTTNKVQNAHPKEAQVTSGYWDITGVKGLQPVPMTPTSNDLPAVRVTVAKNAGNTNGGVAVYLASVFGVTSLSTGATATAAVASPGYVGPKGLFPLAMPKCMYDNFWSTANNAPITYPNGPTLDITQKETQTVGQPYVFDIGSTYHVTSTCDAGQWTSFNPANNGGCSIQSDNCIDNMITGSGNTGNLSIGDQTFIKSGTANNLFKDTNNCSAAAPNPANRTCEWEAVPVVDSVATGTTGQYHTILAFACLHILRAKNGANPYVTVQMSADQSKCTTPNSGGSGPNYGAITPPRLVQ